MNEKMKQERVFVFIDGSNLYHGLKNHLGNGKAIPIDVRKLCEILSGTGRRLVRILYYTAPVKQQENKESYRRQQTSYLSKKCDRFIELTSSLIVDVKIKSI